ncbi:perlwapin-like [Haliotis rubra]|uniref:perlwapin-like n=1 Tax=Haliotis rubra TaxID=36100 RepID=UPI001EE5DA26|nr:perlwapin-like [Haliotis rubra]
MAGPSCILAIPLLAAVVFASIPKEPVNPCATVHCKVGTVCKVNCARAPCSGIPRCVPTNKPGSCPVPKPGQIGVCIALCTNDADCDGDQKCCGGCPRECTPPAPPIDKPGTCPPIATPYGYRQGYCKQQHQCNKDFDCGGKFKCCGSCPRRCVSPFLYYTRG